ncbi:4-hydroxyphenylacetate 3-monooxygenase, oxygenase component [Metabacillus sp. GX 13764]|uniref:4-hydroxyphenylacetate 3-monooxygenase, oxygenase component n=1 Tax=Metabacillus kandeliae TaxID=2900151 RepID=UPI001E651809|nr:4-hydroxyphenylacetate 3-monooxygenase, oxygenase component [Metabacillus kandeliae]MCD7036208.1 4-hydroxyphenylacetate 3-monooxygenase, oxygenase component [Metabacillus kandeliae]
MPAISGKEYIKRMNQMNPEIWIKGERAAMPLSEHPAYSGAMKTKAGLYDLQLHPEKIEKMTFETKPGHLAGLSYLRPETKEDLAKRREMMTEWALATCGMMGRTPDYMNTALMSLAASADLLKDQDDEFAKNLVRFYEKARDSDLSFTHSFMNPQTNRSSFYDEETDKPIAAKIIKKTSEGLVIQGARLLATQGGMTDEVLIFPSAGKFTDEEYAYAFSIPSNTKGLSFICRESFHEGDSRFNYPLSSRFDEMDALLVFNEVTVPWERVFFYHRQDLAQKLFQQSCFIPQALHQTVNRQLVKSQFLLGLSQLLVQTLNVSEYQHIQSKISEVIIGVESTQAMLEKAENDAVQDNWGTMRPSTHPLYSAVCQFSSLYPRYIEILQLIGAGGYMSLPGEEDFSSPVSDSLDDYLASAAYDARSRTKIFRLAWDTAMSSFGTRQTQYERFFFGDPVRLSSNLYWNYPREEYLSRVKQFLNLKDPFSM